MNSIKGSLFHLLIILAALSLLTNKNCSAQDIKVPLEIQFPILLKIVTFDKNYDENIKTRFRIGIVYQENYRISEKLKEQLVNIINNSDLKIGKREINFVLIDFTMGTDLNDVLAHYDIAVIFILPLRAIELENILAFSRSKKVMTFSAVPDYITWGISVGLDLYRDKPQILINNNSAYKEGVTFSSQLLKIARLVE